MANLKINHELIEEADAFWMQQMAAQNMATSQPQQGQNYHLSGTQPAQTAQLSTTYDPGQYHAQQHFDGAFTGVQQAPTMRQPAVSYHYPVSAPQQQGGNLSMAQQTQQMLPFFNAHYVGQLNIYLSPPQAPTVPQSQSQAEYNPLVQEPHQAVQASTLYQTSDGPHLGDTTPQSQSQPDDIGLFADDGCVHKGPDALALFDFCNLLQHHKRRPGFDCKTVGSAVKTACGALYMEGKHDEAKEKFYRRASQSTSQQRQRGRQQQGRQRQRHSATVAESEAPRE